MKLSIITVTYQNLIGLKETYYSLFKQVGSFEWIVVDGGSTDLTSDFLKSCPLISKWISEKDFGIYDAMNKGLSLATGEGIIFLNAGDRFFGQVIQHINASPGFIPVQTQRFGKKRMIGLKNRRFGMPYCHQGIVFPKSNLKYDLTYKIASDYDFFLKHDFKEIRFLLSKDQGFVYYDNLGVSAQKWWLRDLEIAQIIFKNFGFFWYSLFSALAFSKGVLRYFFYVLRPRGES